MSSDHWVAVFSAFISFTGLLLVAIQMRRSTKQRGLESLVTVYDINRQLLSLGFSHPKLFAIMNDAKDTDPVWERYYLQMWLNQLALIHAYLHDAVLGGELRESLEREIAEFVNRTRNNPSCRIVSNPLHPDVRCAWHCQKNCQKVPEEVPEESRIGVGKNTVEFAQIVLETLGKPRILLMDTVRVLPLEPVSASGPSAPSRAGRRPAGLRQCCPDIVRFRPGASSSRRVYRGGLIPRPDEVWIVFEKVRQ